ncbi:MAG TPA: PRC-barrel domain-containing protein [Polyangia bacterium]|nr:PRC-barrel domain-containing protein [Polyangia bacterium]
MEITDVDLRDRTVIGADGNAIGQVVAIILDSDAWSVKAVRIKLRSNVAEQVGADHSLFRAGTIEVPTDHVQSVGDAVVLTISADGLRSAKGAGARQAQPPA